MISAVTVVLGALKLMNAMLCPACDIPGNVGLAAHLDSPRAKHRCQIISEHRNFCIISGLETRVSFTNKKKKKSYRGKMGVFFFSHFFNTSRSGTVIRRGDAWCDLARVQPRAYF